MEYLHRLSKKMTVVQYSNCFCVELASLLDMMLACSLVRCCHCDSRLVVENKLAIGQSIWLPICCTRLYSLCQGWSTYASLSDSPGMASRLRPLAEKPTPCFLVGDIRSETCLEVRHCPALGWSLTAARGRCKIKVTWGHRQHSLHVGRLCDVRNVELHSLL